MKEEIWCLYWNLYQGTTTLPADSFQGGQTYGDRARHPAQAYGGRHRGNTELQASAKCNKSEFMLVFRIPIHLIWIQHFREKNTFFWDQLYLSLCLHRGRPGYRRSLQAAKENIHEIFYLFFYFCGPFLPSWIRIRIRLPD